MKISYIISHGVGDFVKIEKDGGDDITLKLEPKYSGTLKIGATLYEVKKGEARIPTASLQSGEYRPKLECEAGVIALTPFTKIHRDVTPKPVDGETVYRLIKRCYDLEIRLAEAEKSLARLDKMCRGHDIFNFERKDT